MFAGRIVGILDAGRADLATIGVLMAGGEATATLGRRA